jgi:hypothetical protein
MTTDLPSLGDLEFVPYINDRGEITLDLFEGKVGVYAIFDRDQSLCYVGLSRDLYASFKQHLVRCPHQCYWIKFQTVDRPNRTFLESLRSHWIAENGTVPPGNGPQEDQWTQAIDAKTHMTDAEASAIAAADDLTRTKLLKDVARRVESEIFAVLESRGVTLSLRFDPKLKDQGLLSLK